MTSPGTDAPETFGGPRIPPDHAPSLSQAQQSPNTVPEKESGSSSHITRRKKSHSLIEKRYRESLNLKFSQLEGVLRNSPDRDRKIAIMPDRTSKRSKRAEILEGAHGNILELQEEVRSLKKRLQTLREATLPLETCRYTLHDDDFIKPLGEN